MEQVRRAAGSYPLALSLAADLTLTRGVRRLVAAPAWRLAVRARIDQLVSDLDAETRECLSYHALEVAYLGPPLSTMRAAHALSVSRATFYRLVKRGLNGLAARLSARPGAAPGPPPA